MESDEERVGSGVDMVTLFPELTIDAAERRVSSMGEKISSSASKRMRTGRGARSNFLLWIIQPSI